MSQNVSDIYVLAPLYSAPSECAIHSAARPHALHLHTNTDILRTESCRGEEGLLSDGCALTHGQPVLH